MLRPLKNLVKEKTLARINFLDGYSVHGFVTYVDDETMEVYTIDNVYNQLIIEESEEGIALESEEDAEAIDFLFVKTIFRTDSVSSIICDISHKFPIEKTTYIDQMKVAIYNKPGSRRRAKNAKLDEPKCGNQGDII
jgi:hypothetical protein